MNEVPDDHEQEEPTEEEVTVLRQADHAPEQERDGQRRAAPRRESAPFSDDELRRALLRPDLAMECALGGRERLTRNLAEGRGMWWLAGLLMATSLLAAVPYGVVAPRARFWNIAVLYTGSLLICFPCLHVFSQFLGMRFRLAQNLVLALLITSVAGLFTFGFFPIIWFIDATTQATRDTQIVPADLSVLLLAVSLAMGMVQMGRCLVAPNGLGRKAKQFPVLMAFWLVLLVFITYRMATVLALL
jgi:hypothetical protein